MVFLVQKNYQVPRKVVVKSLEASDARDSPDRPGMMYEATLSSMVDRFDEVFGNRTTPARAAEREHRMEAVVEHLRKHTLRRRGEAIVAEGLLEWEQTSRVYELFSVDLNVFERIFFTVDVSESTSLLSMFCSIFLVTMIFVSIVVWMVSTLPIVQEIPAGCTGYQKGDCEPKPSAIFDFVETLSVYVFTVEYLIRLLTVHSVRFALLDEHFLERVLGPEDKFLAKCPPREEEEEPPFASTRTQLSMDVVAPVKNKLDSRLMTTIKHVLSPSSLIDFFAILPYWIQKFSGYLDSNASALMVLRMLRLSRVFRVFKLGKYNEVFTLFSSVIHESAPALLLMLFFILLGCCLFGTLIWIAEAGNWHPQGHAALLALDPPITDRGAYLRHDGSKDPASLAESPFPSIIHSFWFVIVTITTVGYGDAAPTTPVGKLIGAVMILNGIIVLAMPIGVVGTNFSNEYYRVLNEKKRRLRLKAQLETLAAVELQQDAALAESNSDSSGEDVPPAQAVEFHRIDNARQRILVEAEFIDQKLQLVLPSVVHAELSLALRSFLSGFIGAEAHHDFGFGGDHFFRAALGGGTISGLSFNRETSLNGHSAGHLSPPPPVALFPNLVGFSGIGVCPGQPPAVSVATLARLDALTCRMHTAFASITTLDDLSEFGLREAHECRRQWSGLVDKCWDYAVQMCRMDRNLDAPDYESMKAQLQLVRSPAKGAADVF